MNIASSKLTAPFLAVAALAMLAGCSETTPNRDGTDASGADNPYRGSSAPAPSSRTPMQNQGQANPTPGNDQAASGTPSRNAPMTSDTSATGANSVNRSSGQTSRQDTTLTTRDDRAASTSAKPGSVFVGEKADNSAQNEVDRDGRTMTPFDQGSSAADIEITRMIRKELTGDESLSINAQNLKVITNNGVVVLRGPVASAAEADTVLMHTRKVTGVTRVTNQIVLP